MGLYRITFDGVLGSGTSRFVTGITDLEILAGSAGPVLVSTTRAGGGLAAFDATSGGLIRTQASTADLAQLIPPDLAVVQTGGQTLLATLGLRGTGLTAIPILPSGDLGTTTTIVAPGQNLGQITGLALARSGDGPHVFASLAGAGLMRLDPQGMLQFAAQPVALTGVGAAHRVSDILTITVQGRDYLVTSHATADAIAVHRIDQGGALQPVSGFGAAQGLGIDAPSAMASVQLADGQYIVLASTLSSSLSVFSVGAQGALTPVDHVLDDLATRFHRVTALEAITVGDRSFIFAGGADDGLSAFLLLPGGRLLHLDSMADSVATTLANVSNITGFDRGQALRLFATSETEPGITQLAVETPNRGLTQIGTASADAITGGALDDILSGGDGADTMIAGAGNDIVMDGGGTDRMTGGPGSDTFVLTADGAPDVITDFQPGQDRLDLSAWVGLSSTDQLRIDTRSWGAELGFRTETLELRSASGSGLSRSEVLWTPILNLTRAPVGSLADSGITLPEPPPLPPLGLSRLGGAGNDRLTGGNGADTLHGGAGNDTLTGLAGDDRLTGGAGQDQLFGGAGNDWLSGVDGNDTLLGGAGDDTLIGWTGADTMDGGEGADLYMVDAFDRVEDSGTTGSDRAQIYQGAGVDLNLAGWRGVERVHGYSGNDTLDASTLTDAIFLFGERGNDMLRGGTGNDTLIGGPGNDTLSGGAGNDWLSGVVGNDNLFGGAGDDTLIGWTGADTMDGGEGADLYMVDALDRVEDTGAAGSDRAQIYQEAGVSLNLAGWRGVERVHGYSGNDTLDASSLRDAIFLFGERGNDVLRGGTGNDTLIGGPGNDTLAGGAGNDWLSGGAGADHFVFRPGFGRDVVAAFEQGQDRIVLTDQPGVTGFSGLQIAQFNADTVIRTATAGPDLVILADFDALRLTADDFLF
ncbi:MAG: hypothetical protein LPJ92_01605 [Rhodobacterales bacterium]|nr:hypothetical protein [Rhodobacterales bacterium]MDX5389010.1 hypothetical protein [Rhodobacterales bacterium]MDX5488699.1 hypothetical protein [Rhodobacterales bacterium]